MKKLFFLLIIIIGIQLLITSCAQGIVFQRKEYSSSYPTKINSEYNSANVKMNIIEAKNADSINKVIFENIKDISYFIENQNVSVENYNQLAQSFISSYKNVKKDIPNENMKNWEYNLESKVNYESDEIINVVIDYFSSYGDLNGMQEKRSLIFNKVSGEQLFNKDIFQNIPKLTRLIQMKFNAKYQINQALSYHKQGFCMENDRFQISKNYLFTVEGILFYYNLNEIAPFEKGHFEVFLSYDELEPFILIK